MFLGSKVRLVREADNLTAIYERLPRQCGILKISQAYKRPRPVTGIAFFNTTTTTTINNNNNINNCKLSSSSSSIISPNILIYNVSYPTKS
jgi:hypothetical protein